MPGISSAGWSSPVKPKPGNDGTTTSKTGSSWPVSAPRQQRNGVAIPKERIRPAVQQQQRRGIGAAGSFMHVMQVRAIELHDVVLEAIQFVLLRAPVVHVAPVREQLVEVVGSLPASQPPCRSTLDRRVRSRRARRSSSTDCATSDAK
jgi:hypothetical protein